MDKILIFIALSIILVIASWRTLFNINKHGFYRFFGWECMAWLFASVYKLWFSNPISVPQLLSWGLLLIAVYMVMAGAITLLREGKPGRERDEKNLYSFEKTTRLVDSGIFRYIRHPLYSSLIFLTWGIYFKGPSVELTLIAVMATLLLVITALYDENECIAYFGSSYTQYMKRSKRFIPFVI